MEEWIYNNKIVQEHSLFRFCGSTLNDVSDKDYQGKYKFNPEIECVSILFSALTHIIHKPTFAP